MEELVKQATEYRNALVKWKKDMEQRMNEMEADINTIQNKIVDIRNNASLLESVLRSNRVI